jgi:hypothetical protein
MIIIFIILNIVLFLFSCGGTETKKDISKLDISKNKENKKITINAYYDTPKETYLEPNPLVPFISATVP